MTKINYIQAIGKMIYLIILYKMEIIILEAGSERRGMSASIFSENMLLVKTLSFPRKLIMPMFHLKLIAQAVVVIPKMI